MSNKKNSSGRKTTTIRDGLRTTVREEIVVGSISSPGSTAVVATIKSGNQAGSFNLALSPLGLTSAYISSGNFSGGANVDPPHLRKLYNTAVDFKYYRVLSGKLIFVPNFGTTQNGQIVLASSRDVNDSSNFAQAAYSSGASYRTFNLSSTKEISIPMDIDSSWKKVTSVLSVPGQSLPFTGPAGAAAIIPMNTVNDLCFTSVGGTVFVPANVTSETSLGTFTVVYDLELKGLIDSSVNS